jgi:hypothetical protein
MVLVRLNSGKKSSCIQVDGFIRSCEAGAGYRALNYAHSIMTKILCVDDDTEGMASRKEVLKSEGRQE